MMVAPLFTIAGRGTVYQSIMDEQINNGATAIPWVSFDHQKGIQYCYMLPDGPQKYCVKWK